MKPAVFCLFAAAASMLLAAMPPRCCSPLKTAEHADRDRREIDDRTMRGLRDKIGTG